MSSKVRVRFAPSPTGFFHLGSARTALFNWLYARHTGGVFILRIEDTDLARSTQEATDYLLKCMRWLGLDWDEGPGATATSPELGAHTPYFQSKRGDIYKKYVEQLLSSGRAYRKEGAIVFKISGEEQVIDDQVFGKVRRTEEKDFVIVRSDGNPVFHLVNVIDDIEMGVTDVIRGQEHLSNTSKHTELFKALGAPLPRYAHLPLILKSDGPGKMSKRDKGALLEDYIANEYIPQAVVNYLALLGWSPKDNREVLSIQELVELFDLPGVLQHNARFDAKKLDYINTEHLKKIPAGEYLAKATSVLQRAGTINTQTDSTYLQAVVGLCREKVHQVQELPAFTGYFFDEGYPINPESRAKVFKPGADPLARIAEFAAAFGAQTDWSEAALETALKALAEAKGLKTGDYIHAVRLALSGTHVGPSFYGMLQVMGRERVMARLASNRLV